MTVLDAFGEGCLKEAIALQAAILAGDPSDARAGLSMVELLTFQGEFPSALEHLAAINSIEPLWPNSRRMFRQLIKTEWRRSRHAFPASYRPVILPETIPRHAKYRRRAIRALREGDHEEALRLIDLADRSAPEVKAFINGQEIPSIRDADDRFASVLEAIVGGKVGWFPWESIRRLTILPAQHLLDRLARPAQILLRDGVEYDIILPLIYPRSFDADGVFAVGLETDYLQAEGGPICCIGAKLIVCEEEEIPLAECRMIEFR